MKKLLLGTLVGMSLAFGAEVNEDLLSVATAGKVKGDKLALSMQEMSEVKGGYYNSYSTYYSWNTYNGYNSTTLHNSIYAQAFGSYYWGKSW